MKYESISSTQYFVVSYYIVVNILLFSQIIRLIEYYEICIKRRCCIIFFIACEFHQTVADLANT